MGSEFISYELALELKNIGFDEKCFAYFNGKTVTRIADRSTLSVDNINTWRNTFLSIKNQKPFVYTPEPDDADTNPIYERLKWGSTISAPLWQQTFDWFREKHNLVGYITFSLGKQAWNVEINSLLHNHDLDYSNNHKTYQEARGNSNKTFKRKNWHTSTIKLQN